MQPINEIVAKVSPNLYSAAKQANLSQPEINQVEQMSYTIKQHRELMAMDTEKAKQKYDSLDPDVQSQLKFMYKNAAYAATPPSIGDRVTGALKTVGTAFASPIIGLFKVAGAYNRVINTPYLVGRELAQADNPNIFSMKVWSDAWDGKHVYDNGALKNARSTFGTLNVTVAKGILAGKTPGEIVQSYGKVDQGILEAIQKAYNDPKSFKQVLDGVKYAQVSPGRDIARILDNRPPATGGLHGDYISGYTKNVSGVIDAIYQIAIDPLTWMTGGLSKSATLGERLATTIEDAAKAGNYAGGVKQVMANPRVKTLWDDQLGPMIKRFAEAPTKGARTQVYEEIKFAHPGYANREVIEALAKPDAKVFDAKSAEKFFGDATNFQYMLSGRVEGVTYKTNGVVVARKHRNYADGLMTYLDSVFNATSSKTLGPLKTLGRDVTAFDAKGEPLADAFITTGETIDGFTRPPQQLLDLIDDASKDISDLKKFGYWIGKQAARSPAGLEIRIGDRAVETAQNFSLAARQILPRDMAEYMTTKFIESPADEQVVILRNLYAATMYKYGLAGEAEGQALIKKVLTEKFGGDAGFATMKNTEAPEHFVEHMEPSSLKNLDGSPMVQTGDAIQPYHSTDVIGALPYNEIADVVTKIRAKKNLMYAIGGSVSGPFAKKVVDNWSLLTLFPRLGVRSAIDEIMMFALTAPATDLLAFAFRKGHEMGKVSTAFTASKDATGPLKQLLDNVIGHTTPADAITLEKRQQLINELGKKLKVDPELLTNIQKRRVIAKHVMEVYGQGINPADAHYLMQGLINQPDMLTSIASSLVGRSGLSGTWGEEVLKAIVDPSALSKALEEMDLVAGRKTRTISTTDLNNMGEGHLAIAHFDNWWKGFVANRRSLPNSRSVDPAHVFFSNDGLRTSDDVKKAMNELSDAIGVRFDKQLNVYYIKDEESVKEFLTLSSRTAELRARGLTDAQIVRDQVGRILADLYTTFHGGSKNFNEDLLNAVKKNKARLIEEMSGKTKYEPTWSQAAAGMEFKNFMKLTANNRPVGEINTAIEFPGFTDPESLWRGYGNTMMEWMDRQINAMYRQPALSIGYVKTRKNWAGIEAQWIDDYVKREVAANPEKYKSDKALIKLNNAAQSLSQKRFTELAMQHSADTVLKYADNPAIRSNFSYGVRTVGRYYRATEDFYRRVYRMKEVSPRVLYRMRLSHLGLSATGATYYDQNGEPYIMLPMDNIVYKATDSTIQALTGSFGYSQPSFNEFTMKLRMINPSFQQDAGLPTLSGPIAGLGVIAIKNLLGYTGNTTAKQVGENIDTFALGGVGDNMNIVRATVPASLQRVWAMLPFDEKSRQEVTAAQQAIAYNAAHGLFLDANSTDDQKADYLNKVRISAHNVIFLRSLLGLIAPATPTVQEGKGVPDYLKRVGITGLRPEFFDILNGITSTGTGDVQDPYELALATFTGKYPGKLIYTVSRADRQTRVVVKNTDGLKNWAIENQKLIDTYGEAAYIFAPQTGNFNSATYNWTQAAGLIQNKSLEKYYSDLLVAQDKQAYYNVAANEKVALAAESNPFNRSIIIGEAEAVRASLKRSNPLLNAALIGQGNNIGSETKMLSSLEQIIADRGTNIDPMTRTRMAMAVKMMRDFIVFATDPDMRNATNFSELKKLRKEQIEANLADLMSGDLYVTEANRAIFKSVLSFYSRDSYVAFKKGF